MLGNDRKYRKTQGYTCLEMLNRTSTNLIELVATRSISWRNLMVWTELSVLYQFFLKLRLIRFDGLLSCLCSNRKSLHADMAMNGLHNFPLLFQIAAYFLSSFLFLSFPPVFWSALLHVLIFVIFSPVVPVPRQRSSAMWWTGQRK